MTVDKSECILTWVSSRLVFEQATFVHQECKGNMNIPSINKFPAHSIWNEIICTCAKETKCTGRSFARRHWWVDSWDEGVLNVDEHAWLLPSEIASIALVYSSFELIQAPAIIIILVWPLLWHHDHLFKTKNYQRMLNWHFVVITRIALRNYFIHKLALYRHSFSILEALDFNHSIFPQVLPVSPRWKQLSLMIKASQGRSLELLQQSVAFKLSYSTVLRAIAAPSFLGLSSHTINQNS